VRVLAREVERARAVVSAGVDVVAGDLCDPGSVLRAVRGCDTVFHAAGMPEQWLRDRGQFHRVNVDGTRAVVDAALGEAVRPFVYTSTIDVFSHRPGVPYDESVLERRTLPSPYERSKQLADQVVAEALLHRLPARFIHPAAVFGPS
jgi:dihydroflavonol-4-reductase